MNLGLRRGAGGTPIGKISSSLYYRTRTRDHLHGSSGRTPEVRPLAAGAGSARYLSTWCNAPSRGGRHKLGTCPWQELLVRAPGNEPGDCGHGAGGALSGRWQPSTTAGTRTISLTSYRPAKYRAGTGGG